MNNRKEGYVINCRYLTFEDRKNLEEQYNTGAELSDIANLLNIHISTLYRELARGDTRELDVNGRSGYSADIAQKAVQESLKRRGGGKRKNSDGEQNDG